MATNVHWISSFRPNQSQNASSDEDVLLDKEFIEGAAAGFYHEDRLFRDFRSPSHNVGWKLHVVHPASLEYLLPSLGWQRASALQQGYHARPLPESYLAVLAHLRVNGIPHKIVGAIRGLRRMASTGQQGKFLTIYPHDTQQLLGLVHDIEVQLGNTHGAAPAPGDFPVGSLGLITARWGGLTSPFTVDAQNKLVMDRRDIPYPDWVQNPFLQQNAQNSWFDFSEEQKAEIAQRIKEMLAGHK